MGFGPSRQMRDGTNYGERPVMFKLADAERISQVVSTVEGARRDRKSSTLPRAASGGGAVTFRIATFTGAWPIGGHKSVRLKLETASTVNATNLFFPIVESPTQSMDCAIAIDGTAWYLIDVPLATATAVVVLETASKQILEGFTVNTATVSYITDMTATLNTGNCTITIQKQTATSSSFVSVTPSTATTAIVSKTVTATFLTAQWLKQ